MNEVVFASALFTAMIGVLALAVQLVRARLVESGPVEIELNGARRVSTTAGVSLLEALAEAGVALPSACAGGGTCGLCRVSVLSGGGDANPIEQSLLGASATAHGARLACQLPVRGDLRIEIPDEVFGVQKWSCPVRSSRNVAPFIKELILALPAGAAMEFRAGAFVQVTAPAYRLRFADVAVDPPHDEVWEKLGVRGLEGRSDAPVTRAYSLANHPGEADIVMLVVRLALPPPGTPDVPPGVVSSWLFGLRPGDSIAVSGPFGNFFAQDSDREMIFVGGGAGMAPMRSHILDQLERQHTRRRLSFWYGARSQREVFYADEFERLAALHDNFTWQLALSEPRSEEPWKGPTGFIHDVLYDHYLADHPSPESCEYYLCGPPLMVKAVTGMLDAIGVEPDRIFFDDFGG